MSTIISVENLGKKYTLHHQQRESYTALRDVISNGVAAFGRKLLHPFSTSRPQVPEQEDFWALKDVSFEVKQGDRIGIIGRNGAGKSTLLKILSRITEPTTGRVKIKGRVASLLEVGTGFHAELTGRENIFLNGAILGMGRAEIKKKFDEIVDFAEIEKFLDTPVKRYSSGMYVRLAFAVAAHLEPEILVVDEVLAVGDAQFQKKCLGKMEDVSAKEGRTVLFVSHNMGAVKSLCNRGVILNNGAVRLDSDIDSVINLYVNSENSFDSAGNDNINCFENVGIIASGKNSFITNNDNASLAVRINVKQNRNLNCGITIYNSVGIPLLSSCMLDTYDVINIGISEYLLELPIQILHSGNYRVEGAIWDDFQVYDQRECLCTFDVLRDDSKLEINGVGYKGYLKLPFKWSNQ